MGSDDGTSLTIARLLVFVRPLSLPTELDDSETGFFSVFRRKGEEMQINHQLDATVFQSSILTFIYSSTCFGRSLAHYQELNDCSSSLWFYLRIVVTVVLLLKSLSS